MKIALPIVLVAVAFGLAGCASTEYLVVTSFFPRSLRLVQHIVSSYPAALTPPCSRLCVGHIFSFRVIWAAEAALAA
jgi:hypothetical protein